MVENGPTGAMPATGGGWAATVTNTGDELIQAPVALTQLTIVDGDGRVVAAPDPDSDIFLGAEGPRWMGLAAGSSLETRIAIPAACATGDWLPSGDYQAYGAITFVDGDSYEQAQGGPWPLTIGGGPETDLEVTVPPGTVPADLECGATWADPQPSTGFELELIDPIRSPRGPTTTSTVAPPSPSPPRSTRRSTPRWSCSATV